MNERGEGHAIFGVVRGVGTNGISTGIKENPGHTLDETVTGASCGGKDTPCNDIVIKGKHGPCEIGVDKRGGSNPVSRVIGGVTGGGVAIGVEIDLRYTF